MKNLIQNFEKIKSGWKEVEKISKNCHEKKLLNSRFEGVVSLGNVNHK